jgi:hypothetical protein
MRVAGDKISFQRTRTGKESSDPQRDEKLDRIEEVTSEHPDRCFAFDQFGPLSIRPHHGSSWAPQRHPDRCRRPTGAPRHPLLPRLLRARRRLTVGHHPAPQGRPHPGGTQIDPRRSARRGADLRDLGQPVGQQDPGHPPLGSAPQGLAVFHPDQRLLANPIEAQFGPLRSFVLGGSDHPNHPVLARKLQAYLRWRNANARHPEVLAAQRRERAASAANDSAAGAAPCGQQRDDQPGERLWSPH